MLIANGPEPENAVLAESGYQPPTPGGQNMRAAAKDATGIAADIGPAVRRNMEVAQRNF